MITAGRHVTELPAEDGGDAYALNDQVGFLLRKAHQRHVAIFSASIDGLTPPQFAALARLHELGECSQNHLGQLIAMDAATIKGVIGRLKARGLVSVVRHGEDRRRILLSLTGQGRATVERLFPVAKAITRETLLPLTVREAETLVRLLGRIS